MLLSYLHEKRYEKQLNQQVKKAADRDDLQIDEIKKTMTIENYFLLTQEHKIHKERILQLESQVKRLNEINEEQRANNEEMRGNNEEMIAKYKEIRANNEEMREFMKQLAKKIN